MISTGNRNSLRSNATREAALRSRTPEQIAKAEKARARRAAKAQAELDVTMAAILAERAAKAAQA